MLRRSRFSVLKSSPLDLEDGLLGRWLFDGAAAPDISGNENDGTPLNAPALIGGVAADYAYNFNGTTQAVSLPNPAPLNAVGSNAPASLAIWVNLTTTQDCIVLGKLQPGAEVFHIRGNRAGNNVFDFRLVVGVTGNFVSSTTLCSNITGKWTHVVGTADGSFLNIYVNGAFEAQSAYTPGSVAAGQFAVGKDIGAGTGTFLNGSATDPRIYNKALSGSEVNAIYNQGLAGYALSPDEWEMPPLFVATPTANFAAFSIPQHDGLTTTQMLGY